MYSTLKIACRNYPLDKIQAFQVVNILKTLKQGKLFDLDFREVGDSETFLEKARREILEEKIDILIYPYSELDPHPGINTLPVLKRMDRRDILLLKRKSLPNRNWKIYIPTIRRFTNLLHFLSTYSPVSLRNKEIHSIPLEGNLLKGLESFASSNADGILLSKSELDRILREDYPQSQDEELLNYRKLIQNIIEQCQFFILPLSIAPSSPGAGVTGIEFRKGRNDLESILSQLVLYNTMEEVEKERNEFFSIKPEDRKQFGITFLKRNYGLIRFAKTTSPGGPTKSLGSLQTSHQPKSGKIQNIYPLPDDLKKITRSPLEIGNPPPGNLFITRFDSWLLHWKQNPDSILWCAGLEIYRKLAEKNLWISGCSEGLGEEEDPNILYLVKNPEFTKLTHSRCENIPSRYKRFITYELGRIEFPDLKEKTHFFWTSGIQFEEALLKFPSILNAYHASSPGITKNYIQKKLGKILDTFLNYESWYEYHTGNLPTKS